MIEVAGIPVTWLDLITLLIAATGAVIAVRREIRDAQRARREQQPELIFERVDYLDSSEPGRILASFQLYNPSAQVIRIEKMIAELRDGQRVPAYPSQGNKPIHPGAPQFMVFPLLVDPQDIRYIWLESYERRGRNDRFRIENEFPFARQ